APLDEVRRRPGPEDPLHEDRRGVNQVGVDLARLDQVLHFGDGDSAGRGHHGVEVPRGLPVDEIAEPVPLPRPDQRVVAADRALHEVAPAIELAQLLPLGHRRADAGGGEEGGDPGAAGPDPLGEGALRGELDLDLAGEHLLLEDLVLAHVARDDLLHLTVLEQVHQAVVGGTGVVGNDGELARAQLAQGEYALFGDAAEPEPAHEQARPGGDAGAGGGGVGEDLVHGVTRKTQGRKDARTDGRTERRKDGRLTDHRQPLSDFPPFRLSAPLRYDLTTCAATSSAAASMPVRPENAATRAAVAMLPGAPGA